MTTKTKNPKTEIVKVEFHGECLMPNGFDRKATAGRIARKLIVADGQHRMKVAGWKITDVWNKEYRTELRAAVAKIIEKELEG